VFRLRRGQRSASAFERGPNPGFAEGGPETEEGDEEIPEGATEGTAQDDQERPEEHSLARKPALN
jgi:hypothetical protein